MDSQLNTPLSVLTDEEFVQDVLDNLYCYDEMPPISDNVHYPDLAGLAPEQLPQIAEEDLQQLQLQQHFQQQAMGLEEYDEDDVLDVVAHVQVQEVAQPVDAAESESSDEETEPEVEEAEVGGPQPGLEEDAGGKVEELAQTLKTLHQNHQKALDNLDRDYKIKRDNLYIQLHYPIVRRLVLVSFNISSLKKKR